ncbi:MAG: hypothetical protein WCO55_03455 [Candidatus Falkowbacteria bacterium]
MKKVILSMVALLWLGLIAGPGQAVAASCIITISGNKYDVTSLQSSHSGGNVFDCGTDMTSVYLGRHGRNLNRMQPYLIATPSPAPKTNATTPAPAKTTPLQALDKQYTAEKKALAKKHQAEKIALEQKQAQERKNLESKYKTLRAKATAK